MARDVAGVTGEAPDPLVRRHRRLARAASVVLVVSMVAAVILVVPALFGFRRFVIVSGSMEPTLPVGSVVYDEVVPTGELMVGDMITFVPPPEFGVDAHVTHRIVSIDVAPVESPAGGSRTYRTKGDANPTVDPWTMTLDQPDQARVVGHLAYVGYIYWALSNRWVQLLFIAVPAVLVGVGLLVGLWRAAADGVREERAATRLDDRAAL